jgi:hypothetical protein
MATAKNESSLNLAASSSKLMPAGLQVAYTYFNRKAEAVR